MGEKWPLFGSKCFSVSAGNEEAKTYGVEAFALGSDGLRLLAKDYRICALFRLQEQLRRWLIAHRYSDIPRWATSMQTVAFTVVRSGTTVCIELQLDKVAGMCDSAVTPRSATATPWGTSFACSSQSQRSAPLRPLWKGWTHYGRLR